jgi:ribosomal-protein-alanine N-acetyltransferase
VKSLPILETERLLLRPFTKADADDVQRLAGDRAIAATTLSIPHPYEDGMAEAWIAGQREVIERGESTPFAIERKCDGALIGSINLMDIQAGHQAEFGYWVGVPYWNRGYCTEAAEAMLDFAFAKLGLVRVHARHLSRNPASGRVMQKLGMHHEGTRRHHVRKWDVLEDVELYGILLDEYRLPIEQP